MAKANEWKPIGEGTRIPSVLRRTPNPTQGLQSASVRLELDKLPAPQKVFVADCFQLKRFPGYAQILIGQRKVDASLRALLDLRISEEPLQGVISSIPAGAAAGGATSNFLMEFVSEPDQALAMEFNFARFAGSPTASTLDLFYMSGPAVTWLLTTSQAFLEPVARIQMPNPMYGELLGHLIESFRDLYHPEMSQDSP